MSAPCPDLISLCLMDADLSACLQSVSPHSVCDGCLPAVYKVQSVPQIRLRYGAGMCVFIFNLTLIDMYGGVLYLFIILLLILLVLLVVSYKPM